MLHFTAYVIDKAVRMGMLLIRLVRLCIYFLPCATIERREKGIGLFRRIKHLSQTQAVGKPDCLGIHLCTSYDIHILICCA